MSISVTPGFVSVGARRLFCMRYGPAAAPVTRRVLVIAPFGEEMNKCRRLLAQLCRALAARGAEVWVPDLYGTGDSEGDFSEASWSDWQNDVIAVDAEAAIALGALPVVYLALRTGALLLAQVHARLPQFSGATVMLWQPVLDGSRYLAQFLRLRVMASRLAGQDESQQQLMQQLADGHSIEVAGYGLNPALAFGLQDARAGGADFVRAAALCVLEFKLAETAQASVPVQNFVRDCIAGGTSACAQVINCEQFWATQEIAAPQAAIDASLDMLSGLAPAAL